jgi:curved DNA-binding protein CbpA
MALQGMAREILSKELRQKGELRFAAEKFSRIENQWHVLFAANHRGLYAMGGRDSRGFRFCGEGLAFFNFMYCRLHGSGVLYASGYDRKSIDEWAKRAVAWAAGREPKDAERVIQKPAPKRGSRDVYFYFDNDAKMKAPGDAVSLIERMVQPRSKD